MMNVLDELFDITKVNGEWLSVEDKRLFIIYKEKVQEKLVMPPVRKQAKKQFIPRKEKSICQTIYINIIRSLI